MNKSLIIFMLFPFYLFSQSIIEIDYEKNNYEKKFKVVPLFSSHFASNT